MLSTSLHSSKSTPIPIPNHDENCRHNKYYQSDVEHASKVAEWQESQMYQRLLHGMFLSCQRSDYHPKAIRSLENLMQTQALPLSSLEALSATSDNHNEEWVVCNSCSGKGDGEKDTKGQRVFLSPDCWCRSDRTHSSSSLSWRSCSVPKESGAAPDALQQHSKSSDEEEDGLIFDFEI
eukprot:scaffold22797_cov152-Skeletonema_menzelii.AAC.1